MKVRHESQQTQKVPRSLQHLKHASWFHVGEVWFSGRHTENRTCLFRFCHSLGDVEGCSVNWGGRVSSGELLQRAWSGGSVAPESPEHMAACLWSRSVETRSEPRWAHAKHPLIWSSHRRPVHPPSYSGEAGEKRDRLRASSWRHPWLPQLSSALGSTVFLSFLRKRLHFRWITICHLQRVNFFTQMKSIK